MLKTVDISGEYKLFMDKSALLTEREYNDTISLPSTTSFACKGEENKKRETGFLTDAHKFEGNAWFAKNITIDNSGDGRAFLLLERTRLTTLFVDGEEVGSADSLNTPHIYDITRFADGGEHFVEILVKNVGYKTGGGHLTSQDTQTNWNGITGRMEIFFTPASFLKDIMLFPDIKQGVVKIRGELDGNNSVFALVCAKSDNTEKEHVCSEQTFEIPCGEFELTYDMGEDFLKWDEFSPAVYTLTITAGEDKYDIDFGMRDFSSSDGKFTINGVKTFLRGKHDGLIFPKTGFAPTTVDEWERVLSISKSYGFNHYRFHTCCPPEAAFAAADRLGIYFEPQLPFWGTIADEGEEGFNAEEQDYLVSEGFRILKAFGSHPSFCMFSLGNELWGSQKRLDSFLKAYKEFDDRHLYTQGSNNFQWFPAQLENDDFFVGVRLANDRLIRGSYAMCDAPQGFIQTSPPTTAVDYDSAVHPVNAAHQSEVSDDGTVMIQYGTTMKEVKASEADADFIPTVPIVTHEIGQYETFPDFDEIKKYTGPLKARNFEVFRERLEKAGLLKLDKAFFESSGRLARDCYKAELEAVFRSRTLAGFQILDLQDFTGQGTALVGMLDAFMDSKGLITPEEYRQFNNSAVLLARFEKFVYAAGEEFRAHIELAYFGRVNIDGRECSVTVTDSDSTKIFSDTITLNYSGENYIDVSDVCIRLPEITSPERLMLELCIEGTDIQNRYEISVYPDYDISDIPVFEQEGDKTDALLSAGKNVLIVSVPDEDKSIEGTYCTDFWCYPMFKAISDMMGKPRPVGTMGLLIDNKSDAFSQFLTYDYTTPDWYDIVSASRSLILDGSDSSDVNVLVRTIDNFERNHSLALVYEYKKFHGKVVRVCADFEKLKSSLAGRALLKSLGTYLLS